MANKKIATKTRVRSAVKSEETPEVIDRGSIGGASPLVFISHDTRDADIAEAFSNLLTDASGGVLQSFRSSDRKGTAGIEFGAEWYSSIMSKLNEATEVVALLTQHSLDRPWILYEAGVARGKLDTPTLGVALGIPLDKASTGPFAQFQNCGDDEDSLTKLVMQLIKKNPQANPREEAVGRQVQVFCTHLKSLKESRGKSAAGQSKVDEVSPARMFEEVKVLVRELPSKISQEVGAERGTRRFRGRRLHPGMLEEMLHYSLMHEDKGDISSVLHVVFSAFKDDLPWAYELGTQLATALGAPRASITRGEARTAWLRLMRACDLVGKGPFSLGFNKEDGESLYVLTRFVRHMEDFFPLPTKRVSLADAKTN